MASGSSINKLFLSAKLVLFFLILTLPLAVTNITYNRSDLPKNTVFILVGSIFVMLILAGILIKIYSAKKGVAQFGFQPVPLIDIPVILLLLSAALSTVFSINQYISFFGQYERQLGLITYIYLFLIFVFSSLLFKNETGLKKMVSLMEITAVLVSVYAILQQFGYDFLELQPVTDSRPVTTIGSAVFAGGFLALALPLSAYNVSGKKNNLLKIIFPLIILAGIVVTRTRSAYIAVFVEMIISFVILMFFFTRGNFKKKKYLKYFYFGAAAFLLFIVIFIFAAPGNVFSQRVLSIFNSGNNQRWTIWRDAFGVFWKYPLTGPGIGTFPNAFAEFYSYELRYTDVMRYVDNAHNNYLQVLFTMGIAGFVSYLLLLVSGAVVCLRNIMKRVSSRNINNKTGIIYSSLFVSLAGYSAYSLTNFDEFSILLYLTLIFVLIRNFSKEEKTIKIKMNFPFKVIAAVSLSITLLFIIYCSAYAVNSFSADTHFLKGEKLIRENHFKEGINEINSAVISLPMNPVYRYTLASDVYKYVKGNRNINEAAKKDLLRQAAEELIKAGKNHSNVNACEGLLSLVYFESGRINEAEELKTKVLMGDAINIPYRINLVFYYTNNKEYPKAKEQLEVIENIDYQAVDFWSAEAYYNFSTGNYPDALNYCERILQKEPYNPDALEMIKQIQSAK